MATVVGAGQAGRQAPRRAARPRSPGAWRWVVLVIAALYFGIPLYAGLKFAGMFGSSRSSGEQREEALIKLLERLQPGQWLVVEHPASDTPEMRRVGHKGYENVAEDRANVTRALTSARVKEVVARRKIALIGYADVAVDRPRP